MDAQLEPGIERGDISWGTAVDQKAVALADGAEGLALLPGLSYGSVLSAVIIKFALLRRFLFLGPLLRLLSNNRAPHAIDLSWVMGGDCGRLSGDDAKQDSDDDSPTVGG